MPALKGRTATVLKDSALELLATDDEDPLLAFWPIGLGRTAVFASDVKDRWAADWIRWRGYGPFFTAVVRALERRRPSPMALEVTPEPVRGKNRTIAIAVEARDSKGLYRNLVNPSVDVRSAGGTPTSVRTRQVSPGRYEATIVADAERALTISLPAEPSTSGGVLSRTILPDPAAEYRFRSPDTALLQSLAAATGGRVQPTPDALANVAGDTRAERRPLWPALIAIALGLWLLDILARRVRLFEPTVAD
jgi:Ca-activated chloride channel homolog